MENGMIDKKEQQINIEKIKEGCIQIQERDLVDQIKNLENENLKSSIIIGFIGIIIALLSNDLMDSNIYYKVVIIILFVIPMGLSLYNMSSKKVFCHINIGGYFVNRTDKYEAFLNDIHIRLNDNYNSVSNLLNKKSFLTKVSYFFNNIIVNFYFIF